MKIKEVCEKTGLTDRAVRYYVDCGLLRPDNKENYTGRKNFTFSIHDVEQLKRIKTLRDAGFSVEQIKRLLNGETLREIVRERLAELEEENQSNQRLIDGLHKADIDREMSVEELTVILSIYSEEKEEESSEIVQSYKMPVWMMLIGILGFGVLVWTLLAVWLKWIESLDALWIFPIFCPLLFGCIRGPLEKRKAVICLILTVIGIGVVVPHLVGGMIHRPKTLDAQTYVMIDQIPWNDQQYLLDHGFRVEYDGVIEYSQDYPSLSSDEHAASLYICVEDADVGDVEIDDNYTKYGDIYIREYSLMLHYDNWFCEWLQLPSAIFREYTIVADGYVIQVTEDTVFLDRIWFEEFIQGICGGTT